MLRLSVPMRGDETTLDGLLPCRREYVRDARSRLARCVTLGVPCVELGAVLPKP